VKVKICGLRDLAAARAAVEAGADYLGFIFAPTRRYVAPETVAAIGRELPGGVPRVGLFVNESPEVIRDVARVARLDLVELCGDESPEFCASLGLPTVKSLRVQGPEIAEAVARYADRVAWCKLDSFQPKAYGGTGTAFDWELARGLAAAGPIMLAGGLDPSNVAAAIRVTAPWGVDVSSGVETNGQKDPAKIAAFVAAARDAARARVEKEG
jgi:phosphoribosylanthranilate isomerase